MSWSNPSWERYGLLYSLLSRQCISRPLYRLPRFQLVYQEISVSLTRPIHDSWKPSEVYIFDLRRENSNRANRLHLTFCPNAAKERGRVYSWAYPNESQLRYISPVSFVAILNRAVHRPGQRGKECAQSGSIHSMTSTGQVTSDFISSSTSTSAWKLGV